MPVLDIFGNNAFSVTSLTAAVNNMPFIPGRIGQLGIFTEKGVPTTSVMIEEKNGALSLIPTSPRGAPANQNQSGKRKGRSLAIPHIPLEDQIRADEIQNVRAFGSENELEAVQTVVSDRLTDMMLKHDATLEHLRIGAIKGQILDADGTTVLYNLFDEFGVSAYSEIDFDLDNATPASGAVRKKCHEVIRKIEDALGVATYDHVHAMCSASFFDDLISHPEIVESYRRYQESSFLRAGMVRGSFEYGGIVFEEYRGKVGSVDFIADGKAHFFPVGAQGLFVQWNAPADFVETANTIGLPRYAKQAIDQRFQRFVELHTQSNPLPICTRPKVLIKGKRT